MEYLTCFSDGLDGVYETEDGSQVFGFNNWKDGISINKVEETWKWWFCFEVLLTLEQGRGYGH